MIKSNDLAENGFLSLYEHEKIELTHPFNENIKLLVIADRNDYEHKLYVLPFIIDSLKEWFLSTTVNEWRDASFMVEQLSMIIDQINSRFYSKFNSEFISPEITASLTAAFILEDKTITLTIGNSRIYSIQDGNLKQISNDQSLGFFQYQMGKCTKEELRQRDDRDYVTNAIGYPEVNFQRGDIHVIDHFEYDSLLLLNQHVVSLLSDDMIETISRENDFEILVEQIIDRCIQSKKKDGNYLDANALIYIK